MPGPEHEPRPEPSGLPPEMVEYLRGKEYVCLTQATDLGTALIIKAPGREIQAIPGRVPIRLQHELYDHPAAPVIRMLLTILDQPRRPLRLETFINVEDEQQRSDYAAFAEQEHIPLLFFDEAVRHRRTISVTNSAQESVRRVLGDADRLAAAIPKDRFDFDRAKAAVMQATSM